MTIGVSADATAKVAGVDRADADAYALRSHQRAAAAWAAGHFDRSVVPVRGADGEVLLAVDDAIRAKMTAEDFAAMPLLFPDDQAAHDRVGRRLPELGDFPARPLGVVGAADRRRRFAGPDRQRSEAGSGSAGAAGPHPRRRDRRGSLAAVDRDDRRDPPGVGDGRASAPQDIDIVEANESFSVSPLVVQREFGFADDIINVDGGAVSMGHPLGGSGGMLLATALDALERTGGRYGLLTIPAALGLGTAIVIERLDASASPVTAAAPRPWRVVQWATGAVGKTTLRSVIEHPDLELVGLYVYSDRKVGRDAGEIARLEPTGVIATNDIDEILALDADVVLHTARVGIPYESQDADIMALLESGKNVITTLGQHYPRAHGPEREAMFADAARRGGVTLFGAGINPGFVLERLALTATGMCLRVDSISVREVVDASSMPDPAFVFDVMGMGTDPSSPEMLTGAFAQLYNTLFAEAIQYTCDQIGVTIDRSRPTTSCSRRPGASSCAQA